MTADETVFETGPSFVENERPADRLAEMPAWLQTFAATVDVTDEPAEGAQSQDAGDVAIPVPADEHANPVPALPDWLRAEPFHTEQVTPVHAFSDFESFVDPGEHVTDSFISEDDLPDWLRAFSNEATATPGSSVSTASGLTQHSATPTSSTLTRVPPVENVWLSAQDRQVLGPGRTLFALLASNGGTATYDIATATHEIDDAQVANTRGAAREGAQAAVTTAATPTSGTAAEIAETKPGNPLRLLLLALLVVVLLAIVSYTFLG